MKFCSTTEEQKNVSRNFSCDHCNYKSDSKAVIKQHINDLHLLKDTRVHKCFKCNKILSSPQTLRTHSKICVKSEDERLSLMRFSCDYCEYKCFRKTNFLKHVQVMHSPRDPDANKCSKCSKQFSWPSGLKHHYRICGLSEKEKLLLKRYPCDHCEYRTNQKAQLENHVNAKHPSKDLIKLKRNYPHLIRHKSKKTTWFKLGSQSKIVEI